MKSKKIFISGSDDNNDVVLQNSKIMEYVGSIYYPCYCFYEYKIADDIYDGVLIRLDEYGNILELQVDYSELEDVDVEPYELYFKNSLDDFVNEYKQKYNIINYDTYRYFRRLENKICDFYTVTFNEQNGATFAENVVFTHELIQ